MFSVVLHMYSRVNQLHMYLYLFFFRFFSLIDYYKILNLVPCTIVGPCCLPILYIVVCMFQSQTSNSYLLNILCVELSPRFKPSSCF